TMRFFDYETDTSDDEPDESGAAPAPRRRVARSLVSRVVYYPPRLNGSSQCRVDFVKSDEGVEFFPPLMGVQYDEGDDRGMDSDFPEEEEDDEEDDDELESPAPASIPRPLSAPARSAAISQLSGASTGHSFSPSTMAASGVAQLSFGGAGAEVAPAVDGADYWRRSTAAETRQLLDDIHRLAPAPSGAIMAQHEPIDFSSLPPISGNPVEFLQDLTALTERDTWHDQRAPTLAPVAPELHDIVLRACDAMVRCEIYTQCVVDAYTSDRLAPMVQCAFDALDAPQRHQYRQLHAAVENLFDVTGWRGAGAPRVVD
ncbi:hypothetical protein PFISCL1PPCAC_18618, partial [Pristionchus fissidentatus]